MEINHLSLLVYVSPFLSAALINLLLRRNQSRNSKQRPPGPPGFPILGNILDLGSVAHQNLYKLRPKYGPVVWLNLGSINTLVIQSAEAASELFKNYDNIFCDRKCPDVWTAYHYSRDTLGLSRYGAYWRVLKRIYSTELFSTKRINETASIRRKCIDNMVQGIEKDVAAAKARGESGEVNLAHCLFVMAFNVVGNLTFSRDLLDSQSKEGLEFFSALDKVMLWGGKPNLADFLPWLKKIDPQGIKRNMVREMARMMKIVNGFVKERVEYHKLTKEKIKDFLDSVLEYESDGKEGPDRISHQQVNTIITEMFLAGSETTSTTLEWAMTELLRNPEAMRKTKEELDRVVGPKNEVEETNINDLPYLKAVLKETFRLHPPVPLLLPRNALQDTEFMEYHIPKDTQVFVNAWAIGRDPEYWEDSLSFKPERFLGSNIDFKGQSFELIPFGAGRRMCVGISLADRVLHLGLASLLHHFNWELPKNVTPETIDMNERVGLSLRKLEPMKAIPKKRFI